MSDLNEMPAEMPARRTSTLTKPAMISSAANTPAGNGGPDGGGHGCVETHDRDAPSVQSLAPVGQRRRASVSAKPRTDAPDADNSRDAAGQPVAEMRTKASAKPTASPSASHPIAVPPKGRRQTEARGRAKPNGSPPPSALHATRKGSAGRSHAPHETQKKGASSGNHAAASDGDGRRDGHGSDETQPQPAIPALVTELVQLQRIRVFCIVSQSRCDRSIESLLASVMGFRIDGDEKDRKAVFARAKAFRLACEKEGERATLPTKPRDETPSPLPLHAFTPMVLASAASRAVWDKQRNDAERDMERIAKLLPVWPFVEGVRGLGAKGLAILTAEAGLPLGDYRSVSGVWKRLGLAVIDGERQRKKSGLEDAARHGYSPRRRSQVWAVCSDALFRAQWRGADEEAGLEARPIGPYGEVYARRRAHTAPRIDATAHLPATDPGKWTKGRCHNDGRRVMTKALLRDLWAEWRRATKPPSVAEA